jgi:hypothetical protein
MLLISSVLPGTQGDCRRGTKRRGERQNVTWTAECFFLLLVQVRSQWSLAKAVSKYIKIHYTLKYTSKNNSKREWCDPFA